MIVAVDTGGTKTLITSFNKNGEASEFIKFPTPKNYNEYINILKDTLAKNYGHKIVQAIVIAIAGTIDKDKVRWCPSLKWENINIINDLHGILDSAQILVENDAKIAGIAASRQLRPIPKSLFYVTIGTGIGTAMIVNGKIDQGMIRSEGGHMLLEFDGIVTDWERFASGRAIYETFGKYARDITDDKIWYQIAKRISRGLLAAIPLIQPDVISIGGGIGTYLDKYINHLIEILKTNLPSHIDLPKIVKPEHAEETVIYGCYYYAIDSITDN